MKRRRQVTHFARPDAAWLDDADRRCHSQLKLTETSAAKRCILRAGHPGDHIYGER